LFCLLLPLYRFYRPPTAFLSVAKHAQRAGRFFGAGFFSFFCSAPPLAANASAILQIKTRNILISFSFWGCLTPRLSLFINRLSGCFKAKIYNLAEQKSRTMKTHHAALEYFLMKRTARKVGLSTDEVIESMVSLKN